MKRLLAAVLIVGILLGAATIIWTRLPGHSKMAAEIILFAYEDRGITGLYGISPNGGEHIPLALTNPAISWMDDLYQQVPHTVRTVSSIDIELTMLHSPAWVADGRLLTYQNYLYRRACHEIIWMDITHKEPTAIACVRMDNLDEMLDWASDGQHIAFAWRESTLPIIQILDAQGEQTERLFPGQNVWGLAWSPDAAQIAVTLAGNPSLRIYQLNRSVTDFQPEAPAFGKPSWAPDGSALAFLCYAQEKIDICVQPTDGTQGRRISFPAEFPYLKYHLQWSPDGTQLLFVGQQRGGREDLFVIRPDGSDLRQLTTHPASDLEPAWSPDGQHIVFVSMRDGNKELYTVSANGTGLTRLTYTPGHETNPAWKP